MKEAEKKKAVANLTLYVERNIHLNEPCFLSVLNLR